MGLLRREVFVCDRVGENLFVDSVEKNFADSLRGNKHERLQIRRLTRLL